jgi:hypothetical protein
MLPRLVFSAAFFTYPISCSIKQLRDSNGKGCHVCKLLYKGVINFRSQWANKDVGSDVEVLMSCDDTGLRAYYAFHSTFEVALQWFENQEYKAIKIVFYKVRGTVVINFFFWANHPKTF